MRSEDAATDCSSASSSTARARRGLEHLWRSLLGVVDISPAAIDDRQLGDAGREARNVIRSASRS